MELENFGANCFRLKTKKTTLIIDDNLASLAGKSITKPDDVSIFTSNVTKSDTVGRLSLDTPGEYEVGELSIVGVPAPIHTDEPETFNGVVFKVIAEDVHIAFTGHISSQLTDKQLETIGHVDILVIPVGGNGYTLDPQGAAEVIKKIEPKLVIPSQYSAKNLKYEVPAVDLDEAIKQLGIEAKEVVPKLKIKQNELPEQTLLQVIEIQ